MNRLGSIIIVALALGVFHDPACSPKTGNIQALDPVIKDFISSDWSNVEDAKNTLESRQVQAIPQLIQLLSRDEKVELKNTADLIYPGAKEFYGHGGVLDYDVDWISVRAGWALEQITFQHFGFREGAIKEADLLQAVITGQQDKVRLSDPSRTAEVRRQTRNEAVARAQKWWHGARSSWNRLDAILEALQSDDPLRQVSTLSWIRLGRTKCDGLTRESFKKYLQPEVKKLSKSADEGVRVQAQLLLDDKEEWWLKYKQEAEKKTP